MYNKRKHFGQYMLENEETLKYEVDMLQPKGKVVLEIGGGTGNLSRLIAETAKHLIIIEKDFSFADSLKFLFKKKKNVTVIEADFLDLNEKEILEDSKQKRIDLIISNVPYSISSPLLFKLKEFNFEKAILCLQKEFVERMIAKPGEKDWSRLSVMTNYYFKPIYLKKVPKGSFKPVPKVDSAIVMLFKREKTDNPEFDKFIERLFSHRKKTLGAAAKAKELMSEYPKLILVAEKLGMQKRRVFTLTIEELEKVHSMLKE
ncbi:MAG: 16S rRNA (adenine(1518)-N(6)/adenine(1519)-N(6))-dimethyltransferase RsmA [Candidatus Micrarchaeia archaeon]